MYEVYKWERDQLAQTYWAGNGKEEKKLEILHDLIDDRIVYKRTLSPCGSYYISTKAYMPSSQKGGKNWRLEQLRRAKNAYYRLFNDGDYNQLFDNALKELTPLMGYRSLCPRNIDRVMNLKIKRAWNEQFVNL